MFGIHVSRSNAVSGADGVAQLLGLREAVVPGKGHDRDSWAEIIHILSVLLRGASRGRSRGAAVHLRRRREVRWGMLGDGA
jgi:hypothetical protein